MMIFKKFYGLNRIKIYTPKRNKLHNLKKKFLGGAYPRTPLAKRMASRHANFQI